MATTFTKIATVSLATTQAEIEFTSIPATYTDLCVKFSVRCNRASPNYGDMAVRFNGSTSGYSQRNVIGDGSSAGSSTSAYVGIDSLAATASTFSNIELYVPNYSGSNYKSFSLDTATENNGTENRNVLSAGLWSDAAAITSLKVLELNSASFVQYSTATLYGISKT
jgi:hypothetical protein